MLNSAIENTDLISVQDLDTALAKVRQFVVIKIRFFVFEKSKTFANALAFWFFSALAAIRTLNLRFIHGIGEFKFFFAVINVVLHRRLHMRAAHNITGAVQEHPRCGEARMGAAHDNYIFDFLFVNAFNLVLKLIAQKKRVRKQHTLLPLGHLWEPVKELRVQRLSSALAHHDSLCSELHVSGAFLDNFVGTCRAAAHAVGQLDLAVSSCGVDHDFASREQLYVVHLRHGVKNAPPEDLVNVVQQVVPCEVQDHAHRREGDAARPKLKSHLNNGAMFV